MAQTRIAALYSKRWKKTEQGFQRTLETEVKNIAKSAILKVFTEAQEDFLKALPAQKTEAMPLITGNLHDSIASVVSMDGRVVKASYTTPIATTVSQKTGKSVFKPTTAGGRSRIIGSLEASEKVRRMNGKYPKKIAVTPFVAVPYYMNPQMRGEHMGYLDVLRDNFVVALESAFRDAENMIVEAKESADKAWRKKVFRHVLEMKGSLDDYVKIAFDEDDPRIAPTIRRPGRPKGSGRKKTTTSGPLSPGMSMKILP